MIDFSIIVPTYNNEKKILRTIQSVISQKHQNWELVIVDDGSTDKTEEEIQPFLKDKRILYVKQQNKGVTVARHTGFKNAQGEYICFLDSDDEVKTNWLEDFNKLKGYDTGYISCGYTLRGEDYYPKVKPNISKLTYSSLAGTFALKKSVYEGIGGYDPNLKQSENYEMTARALEYCYENELKVVYTNNCNFIYHHSKTPEQKLERYRLTAEASLYLHHKYQDGGILYFRKDNYLKTAAVNYIRVGELDKSRTILHKIFKKKPSLKNFMDIVAFKIPLFRRKIWMKK